MQVAVEAFQRHPVAVGETVMQRAVVVDGDVVAGIVAAAAAVAIVLGDAGDRVVVVDRVHRAGARECAGDQRRRHG